MPASGGAAQRPTPPALTRPGGPAPTPPCVLVGWAAALSSPRARNQGQPGESQGRGPQPPCTCPAGRHRVSALTPPAGPHSLFPIVRPLEKCARVSVASVAKGTGGRIRARSRCVGAAQKAQSMKCAWAQPARVPAAGLRGAGAQQVHLSERRPAHRRRRRGWCREARLGGGRKDACG